MACIERRVEPRPAFSPQTGPGGTSDGIVSFTIGLVTKVAPMLTATRSTGPAGFRCDGKSHLHRRSVTEAEPRAGQRSASTVAAPPWLFSPHNPQLADGGAAIGTLLISLAAPFTSLRFGGQLLLSQTLKSNPAGLCCCRPLQEVPRAAKRDRGASHA